MNKTLLQWADRFNQMSQRERGVVLLSSAVVLIFLFWQFFAAPVRMEAAQLQKKNTALKSEIAILDETRLTIEQRMQQGVHRKEQYKLQQLQQELTRVNRLLDEKTSALIEPDEMFELMQQMIFAQSRLKLTDIRRIRVQPLFSQEQENTADEQKQPAIYRHVMKVGFDGRYQDVLEYVKKLEQLPWQLIWDDIELSSQNSANVHVDIEISTLSDTESWVGL